MRAIHAPHRPFAAVAAAVLLSLAACSDKGAEGDAGNTASEPSGDTLAEAISDDSELGTVSRALADVGLSPVFDGAGSYTILAPTDAAFAKLGDAGEALSEPDQRAAMAAVLRDHIVPGYLTPTDIETAIDAQGGTVEVETMGDHKLRFTRDGEHLKVTNEDGSSATFAGDALKASNGVAIPLDGVLKNLEAPAA